jgi:hypothetical protein
MTMQDLHDTLQDIDDEPANMIYPHLVSSAGKEDLGGGVTVGITLTLRNAQIGFARRDTIVASGYCTQDATSGFTTQQLINASGTFISDGVSRGMWVSNNTQGYPVEVLSADSETQLSLLNSDLGVWTSGDSYTIWETAVCDLTGGNLVATDFDGNTTTAIFPTYGNTITKTSSSSATLSAQQQLEYGTFGGGVHVDLSSSHSGTTYPIGTPQQPVNNFSDALTIAATRGFTKFFVKSSCTIDSGLNFSNFEFEGESPNKTTFTISAAADVTNCEFTNATVQGTLDGGNVLTDCSLLTLAYVEGIIQRCLLLETITLSGAATAFLLDCWSGVPGTDTPIINMGGSGSELAIRNYSGGIKLTNRTGTDACSIDMNSGQVIIDNTVTNGTITLRGVGKWTNEETYSGGATIANEMISANSVADAVWDEQLGTHLTIDSAGEALGIIGSGVVDTNVIQVSGESVSINDFVGEAASLTTGAIADAVWDETLTGSNHNNPTSAGRRLRAISSTAITTGICPSGGTVNTILLNGDASTVDGAYDPSMIAIINGSGLGQTRMIYQYDGANRIAAVDRNWKHIPDTTSEYAIYAHPGREHVNEGLAQCGSGNCLTLNQLASDINDAYVGQLIFLRSGVGEDQVRLITGYDGTTKVATVDHVWDVNPDNTTGYAMLPAHDHEIVKANIIQVSGVPVTPKDLTAEGVWDYVMDAGYTAEETMKIMIASLAGKLSGAGTTEIRIRDVNDTKDRIVATVTPSGNRTVVTLDGS